MEDVIEMWTCLSQRAMYAKSLNCKYVLLITSLHTTIRIVNEKPSCGQILLFQAAGVDSSEIFAKVAAQQGPRLCFL